MILTRWTGGLEGRKPVRRDLISIPTVRARPWSTITITITIIRAKGFLSFELRRRSFSLLPTFPLLTWRDAVYLWFRPQVEGGGLERGISSRRTCFRDDWDHRADGEYRLPSGWSRKLRSCFLLTSAGFLATLSTWFRDLFTLDADSMAVISKAGRGLADRGLLLSFGDLEDGGRGMTEEEFGDGARSEFTLAESLWMDVLETSLSSCGHWACWLLDLTFLRTWAPQDIVKSFQRHRPLAETKPREGQTYYQPLPIASVLRRLYRSLCLHTSPSRRSQLVPRRLSSFQEDLVCFVVVYHSVCADILWRVTIWQ